MNMERPYEKLLRYVKVHTASDDKNAAVLPSAEREFDLAKMLVKEMKAIGIKDAFVDKQCYVYGSIPATKGLEKAPKLGFIAHLDTVPEFPGDNVNPQVIEYYDGKDVKLGTSGRVLSVKNFPHLKKMKGRTLITTDGTTLLGADDKAGVAEIMCLAETLIKEKRPHGYIGIAFTPDEEIGRGPDGFDVKGFGCDYAYTLDGGAEGEIENENFNASSANVEIKGFSVHPGSSKDRMVNASVVACEFNRMLPEAETPSHTSGHEGFYHLTSMSGDVENAKMHYILRDHDLGLLMSKEKTMKLIEQRINEKYGEGTCKVTIRESYRNMLDIIKDHQEIVDIAIEATKMSGLKPEICAIRGGTDGATLSYMGLPCPNLFTGGYAYHGAFEHVTAEGMDKALETILHIVELNNKLTK